MNREQPKRKINVILKIGLLLLGFGTGPILLLVLLEAMGINTNAGNAVGPGLLHVITLWPAVVFLVLGIVISLIKKLKKWFHRKKKK
ncbi:hypothetical protein KKF70_03160 [bacterium]|nr:hypothetical protein [Candidatus Omnitrophota bacterium]MBU2528368.1 hypothetical protein [bacterium]MBU3930626.1 hypothetical protein [bacterium]